MSLDKWMQQKDEPIFPDILWSKPENKKHAGKLLIIGGHTHELHAPIKAYEIAKKSGIGEVSVVMPDKVPEPIRKQEHVKAVPSSKSGGLSLESYNELSVLIDQSNVVLWPGALGRDSESTQLLEKALTLNNAKSVLVGDSADSIIKLGSQFMRPDTCYVITLAELSSLNSANKSTTAITHNMQLTNLVELLCEFTAKKPLSIATYHLGKLIVSSGGFVSTTDVKVDDEDFRWRIDLATHIAVLWAQFPSQLFEALTTAVWQMKGD